MKDGDLKYYPFLNSWINHVLLNPQVQPEKFGITIDVYRYHSKTNYPFYLDRPNYYEAFKSIFIREDSIEVRKNLDSIVKMGWADPRILSPSIEETIQLVRSRFGWKPFDLTEFSRDFDEEVTRDTQCYKNNS